MRNKVESGQLALTQVKTRFCQAGLYLFVFIASVRRKIAARAVSSLIIQKYAIHLIVVVHLIIAHHFRLDIERQLGFPEQTKRRCHVIRGDERVEVGRIEML